MKNERLKSGLRALPDRAERLGGAGVCLLCGVLTLILTLSAFLFTTGMEIVADGEGMDTTVNRIFELEESVVYYSDSFVANLLFLVVAVLCCRLLLPVIAKLRFRYEAAVLAVWTVGIGLVWVFSSQVMPTFDSAYVAEIAQAFTQGDFSDMAGDYIRAYPFQLGYIELCELILRAATVVRGAPPDTFLVLEAANVGFLAAAYVGLLALAKLLFREPRAGHLTFLLLLFCAQPVIFCVFTYGIVPGICFAVWAIVFQTLWFRQGKLRYGLLSALCIALAVLVKSNNLIVLIAMLITAALRLLKRKRYGKDIAVMLAACLCALTVSPAVRVVCEKRSGVTPEPGMPYISWIAMGLSESRRAPGWYSNVTSDVKFEELDYDADALAAYSKEVIGERIDYFCTHPQYTRDFFYRKFVSQFNETTYQSIWNNKVRDQYKEKGALAAWACGDGEADVRRYMDVYAQLVFVGLLVALALMLRKREYTALVLPLSVLGGMLFHLLAEGKSQYILPYFVLMIPAAAWGLTACCDFSDRVVNRLLPPKKAPVPETAAAAQPDAGENS